MTLDACLRSIGSNLRGVRATDDDIHFLKTRLPTNLTPDWLTTVLKEYVLAGVSFGLNEDHDESGFGAELIWLNAAQIVSEGIECEPGISVVPLGFLPIGACAEGSGDPYFLDLRNPSANPPLVRIPHDYAVLRPYPCEKIETVTASLSKFFRNSRL